MEQWRRALAAVQGNESKYKVLVQAIAADIEHDTLADGERLPPQRDVAAALGISVQTVTNAYKELERQGLIRCEVGRGSFVSKRMTERMASYMIDRPERSLADFSIARIVHTPEHDAVWREVCATLSTQDDQPWIRNFRPIAGLESHRAAAAVWLEQLGITPSLDSLLITNGAAHGIFLALASLAGPDDVVLTESLTDHGVIGSSNVLGFTLKGLEIDEFGIHPDHFEELCAGERVKALVCTPNLNNPTVALMPESRRRAIAKIAAQYGVYVIEDDVHGPLLEKRPPPIASLIPELGFYCTSFTKSVLTGLRIGYLAMPRRLALRTESILRVTSWMAAPLLAEIAARWIEDGTAAHLAQVQRTRLAARQAMVQRALGAYLRGHYPTALSAWLSIPEHWPLESLVRELRRRNIAVTLPDPFLVRGADRPRALRVCVGAEIPDDEVAAALDTMRDVYEQFPTVHDF